MSDKIELEWFGCYACGERIGVCCISGVDRMVEVRKGVINVHSCNPLNVRFANVEAGRLKIKNEYEVNEFVAGMDCKLESDRVVKLRPWWKFWCK
jgi:hypothetical protein